MKLKQIHEFASSRIKTAGQCISCAYWYSGGKTYDDLPECSNQLLNKIPETTGKKSWGDKGCACPFWTPYPLEWCEKHGLYLIENGCSICEYDYYTEVEEIE